MERVYKGVYRARLVALGVGVNAYLLVDGGEAILIDSGPVNGGIVSLTEKALADIGIPLDALKAVIHTHYHLDHSGGTVELSKKKKKKKLAVAFHIDELEYLRRLPEIMAQRVAKWSAFVKMSGVPQALAPKKPPYQVPNEVIETLIDSANTALRDGDLISVGAKNLRIIHTPGHTIGHICIYVEEDGLLFSGDHVLRAEAPLPFEHKIDDYIRSLERLRRLKLVKILPGHGRPIDDPYTAIDELIERERTLRMRILDLLSQKPMTAFELMQRTWGTASPNPFFAMVQVLAHLRQLNEEGLVEGVEEKGEFRFRLVR